MIEVIYPMNNNTKIIKFHGTEVKNIILQYLVKDNSSQDSKEVINEFNGVNSEQQCETINVQVVAEYVTITFYKKESSNTIIKRELIPTHRVQHIRIEDLE
jgi:hypothetical protein